MKIVAFSHQGPSPKYNHNEDSIVINDQAISLKDFTYEKSFFFKHTGIFAVCDGVGGYFGGEIASKTIANVIVDFAKKEKISSEMSVQALAYEMKEAMNETHSQYGNNEMMSTFVGLFINHKKLLFANVGDSPSFIYRDKKLRMVSSLDTYENKLLAQGMSKEEVEKMDTAHYITAAFGMEDLSIYAVHFSEEKAQKGDKYLLMSDGVYDYLKEDELNELLNQFKDSAQLAKEIERLVLERGANDNYSLIVIEY